MLNTNDRCIKMHGHRILKWKLNWESPPSALDDFLNFSIKMKHFKAYLYLNFWSETCFDNGCKKIME